MLKNFSAIQVTEQKNANKMPLVSGGARDYGHGKGLNGLKCQSIIISFELNKT